MMSRMVIVLVGCALAGLTPAAWAEEPASTSQDERIAALEAKLADALARIEKLEADAAAKPQNGTAARSASAAPKPPPPPKKKDEAADWFPKGTKISGTFAGNQAAKGEVLTRDGDRLVLRIENTHGVHDWELRIKGKRATLVALRTVSLKREGPPGTFFDINAGGPIDAKSLSISGNWRIKHASGTKTYDCRLEMTVN